MSRDKCGAADVAGFMKVVSMLKPSNIKVIGAMAMVRNSVGSNAYGGIKATREKTRNGKFMPQKMGRE